MINSMTGYGSSSSSNDNIEISVDAKSVNGRYLDINLKSPKVFFDYEDKIKKIVSEYISRGRVDIYVSFKVIKVDSDLVVPNMELLEHYNDCFSKIEDNFNVQKARMSDFLHINNAIITNEEFYKSTQVQELVLDASRKCIQILHKSRNEEGKNLKKILINSLNELEIHAKEIREINTNLNEIFLEKLNDKFKKYIKENIQVDEYRMLQEILYMVEKADTAEELDRLDSHINSFKKFLNTGGVLGKKLDFISQELNRETNTIGSKTTDIKISQKIIEMKTIIEQIREQVQNIE